MDQRKITDRLEACRPNSDDLSRPDLREAAAAVARDPSLARQFDLQQRRDAEIASLMRQVAAPAGLADRLLARLAQADQVEVPDDPAIADPLPLAAEFSLAEAVSAAQASTAPPADESRLVTPAAARKSSRRAVLVVACTAAAIGMLAVAALGWLSDFEGEVALVDFKQQALSWKDEVSGREWKRVDWKNIQPSDEPARLVQKYPLNDMRMLPGGYQTVQATMFGGNSVNEMVAYNFSANNQREAYLLVSETKYHAAGTSLGSGPPARSTTLTGNWRMATWHTGSLLYVLLHTGSEHDYHSLVETPRAIAGVGHLPGHLVASAR